MKESQSWAWPDTADYTELQELEAAAVNLKEGGIEMLKAKMLLGWHARAHGASKEIAGIVGCSTHRVRLWARMFDGLAFCRMDAEGRGYIGWERLYPDTPLGLYSACADVADTAADLTESHALFQEALKWALDTGASAHEVRLQYGLGKGERRAPWLDSEAQVGQRTSFGVKFVLDDPVPDGEAPRRVRLKAVATDEKSGG